MKSRIGLQFLIVAVGLAPGVAGSLAPIDFAVKSATVAGGGGGGAGAGGGGGSGGGSGDDAGVGNG